MGYAPSALYTVRDGWKAAIPSAVFAGIAPATITAYGFHNCGNNLVAAGKANDYSLRDKGNRLVDPIDREQFDAIDMTQSKSDMILVTNRVHASWRDANDPRLNYGYEFIGTRDGVNVTYMNLQTGQYGSADNTHLWHNHFAPLRIFANSMQMAKAIISVIKGETVAQWRASGGVEVPLQNYVPPTPQPYLRLAWPSFIPRNHYFGLMSGPTESHGGWYLNERPYVKAIQQRLITLGYVPGITNPASGWADGVFEQPTKDAVARWQRTRYAALTTRYGEVWTDDWQRMFTY